MLMSKFRIVSIIPARSGSKGVPGKNIRALGGVPLIGWSIITSKKSIKIDQTIVSTNSFEYAEIAKSFGADVPFLRPENISEDNSPDLDFILHALKFMEKDKGIPDLVVHLRPTTPFRNPLVVNAAIDFAIKNYGEMTSLRSVHEMSESAYKLFEMNKKGDLVTVFTRDTNCDQSNSNRQVFPKTYIANGYVDILFPKYILKTGKLHGDRVKPFLTDSTLEVDTEADFEALEFQLNNPTKFRV
jgi:CMP-N,N'-diacetyllegionaminic acid synthase